MTRLLKQAFEEASRLDATEQDARARWLLDELASERRWDEAFRASEDALAKLAGEALDERRSGRTADMDLNAL